MAIWATIRYPSVWRDLGQVVQSKDWLLFFNILLSGFFLFLSQALIFASWQDAKYGTLANLAVLLAAAGFAPRLQAEGRHLAEGKLQRLLGDDIVYVQVDLDGVYRPFVVRRFAGPVRDTVIVPPDMASRPALMPSRRWRSAPAR